jgi:NTE family protein
MDLPTDLNFNAAVKPGLTGLVLSGGGARAAYQVGVLKAIAQIARANLRERRAASRNPFDILVGTSAGAINASALAAGADDFQIAVRALVRIWEDFEAGDVYLSDSIGVVRSGAKWITALSAGWALRRFAKARPRSLLDNAPLAELLSGLVPMERVQARLDEGSLTALAVTVSSYTSGTHITFYQSAHAVTPWVRSQRLAVAEHITITHLLASSAIPFIFPARALRLNGRLEYFGDGSMRQLAPISPAIHLGAQRILVIGAGRLQEPTLPGALPDASYPTLGQIAGHALSSIFLDALALDIERLKRVNRTLEGVPPEFRQRSGLRPLDVMVISPSERLDSIAARHIRSLPLPVRALLSALGGSDERNSALASYLLFEAPYTRELLALGYADTMARADELATFLNMNGSSGAAQGS